MDDFKKHVALKLENKELELNKIINSTEDELEKTKVTVTNLQEQIKLLKDYQVEHNYKTSLTLAEYAGMMRKNKFGGGEVLYIKDYWFRLN